MSVSKDKNILNIYSNNDKEEFINNKNQTYIEIEFEKPIIKNWYLSFKSLDTENISQYPIEQEVIIQPYSIFEIREVKEMSNNNLYVKLFMKSNSLNELCGSKACKEIQNNLCLCDDIGDNIYETYPNINLEKIVSITIKNNNQLIKNKSNIGLMKNLRLLDFSNISLTDKNINELIPFLKDLNFLNYINLSLNNLSHRSLKLLSEIIPSFPFLDHIILDQNSFGDDGIIALSDGLKKIDNLKSFSAVYNQIKTDGVEKLSNELKRYKNLYYLNLSNNYLFFEEIDDFVYAIKYMNNLIELNVSNNQISSEGICMIGEILPKTIQKLNFSECEIYQDGFSEFGTYLNRIPNLTSLIIYGNRNGPSGINSLLDGFEFCPHLSYLDFGCNRIEDCDMVLFIKKIRKIKNVKKLILKENYLTDSSILFLLDVINTLTNLEMIDISWNSIEGSNLIEFIGILSKFEKFNCLNIEGNSCESNDINILLDILNQNNLNTKNKEMPNVLWNYKKGIFKKENKIINIEDFVNKYNDN
jgi:Ran GTPase-activating protein (RanGAP) involved in mRNA processing and transport